MCQNKDKGRIKTAKIEPWYYPNRAVLLLRVTIPVLFLTYFGHEFARF